VFKRKEALTGGAIWYSRRATPDFLINFAHIDRAALKRLGKPGHAEHEQNGTDFF
jgi:hypothetical protein